jgi:predicted O-methyltransferase YrrM
MSTATISLTPKIYEYFQQISLREPEVLQKLREQTYKMSTARMQISPEQGQLMRLIVELMNVKKALEIGVFTGYSALSVALALPEDGKLIACDLNEEWTKIAQKYWEIAGVSNKIDLRLAPALETLQGLLDAGEANTFDFTFIDADKLNYLNYYEMALKLTRPGGLIGIDNVLWYGGVADETMNDANTVALRELNSTLLHDERVTISMLPIGDGLTLARKR